MGSDSSTIGRRLRTLLAVFAAWLAFFALQIAVSRAFNRSAATPLAVLAGVDGSIAVLWTFLSLAIAAWHRRIRSITRGLVATAALHVPLFIAAAVLDTAVSRVVLRAVGGRIGVGFLPNLIYYLDFDLVSYVAVVVVVETLRARGALAERQRVARRLELSLNRARLDYLEAQLQPHFLFNSLGAVSELAHDSPVAANRILHQLIAIFRTALARRRDEVTLGEEIVGVEPYLDIQRVRFADWLSIDYHVDDAAVDCLLPRFVLQPLVENAIRHGLSGRTSAGIIDISATVRDGMLVVRVADNGVGLSAPAATRGTGIGLANVRDRLAILYGDDTDHLRLSNSETGGAIAEVIIPVRKRGDANESDDVDAPSAIAATEFATLEVPAAFRARWIAIPTIWLLCGLVWTQQSWIYESLRGRLGDRTWWSVARNDMMSAIVWAALTPLVFWFSERVPLRSPRLVLKALAHLVAGAAVAIIQVYLLRALTSRAGPIFAPEWQTTYFVDFAIFCILGALSHRRALVEWVRAREAAAATLGAEVRSAQARAAALQHIPRVLVASLEGIATTVRRDPSLTERQLTRLGDYLRLALELSDARGITPERARALEAADAALRESGAYLADVTLSA